MRMPPTLILLISSSLISLASSGNLPDLLLGTWDVGIPYDAHQPVGLDARQEGYIRTLHLRYTQALLQVCGKDVRIESVKVERLTQDAFLTKYGFEPSVIGLTGERILEVYVNFPNGVKACGDFEDPGTHIFIGSDRQVVMEVANDYFPLKKAGKGVGTQRRGKRSATSSSRTGERGTFSYFSGVRCGS